MNQNANKRPWKYYFGIVLKFKCAGNLVRHLIKENVIEIRAFSPTNNFGLDLIGFSFRFSTSLKSEVEFSVIRGHNRNPSKKTPNSLKYTFKTLVNNCYYIVNLQTWFQLENASHVHCVALENEPKINSLCEM